MSSAILSFLLGATGWFAVSFLGKPFLDFRNLRSQVHEEIIFTGNLGPMVANKPDCEKAVETLRRLGAKVQATYIKALPPLRWWFSIWGYNLVQAGRGLIGLSNSLILTDDSRVLHINSIQVGLKLPRDYLDEHLHHVTGQILRPRL
jgi:hypothetical protein